MIKIVIIISCLISPVVLRTLKEISMPRNTWAKAVPHWDDETDSLYLSDYAGTVLLRYSLAQNTTQTLTVDGIYHPSFFIPVQGSHDQFVAAANGSAFVINWDGRSDHGEIERTLFTISPDVTMDSAYTSAAGELYTGTLKSDCAGPPTRGFYRYTKTNGLEEIATHYTSTVGSIIINNTLFQMDGCQQILSAWDVNPETRALSNEREVLRFNYFPDHILGLTGDQDGFLYASHYGGSKVIKIDPKIPAVVEEILLPTPLPMGLTFGGPDNELLFVSMGVQPLDAYTLTFGARLTDPPAGDLFLIGENPAPGFPSYRAVV